MGAEPKRGQADEKAFTLVGQQGDSELPAIHYRLGFFLLTVAW